MTAHAHPCTMCDEQYTACSDACHVSPAVTRDFGGLQLVGHPQPCQGCSAALDDIADEPDPTRGELSGASLVRCVARATRAALAADPSRAVETFNNYIDPLAPWDPTRTDHDTWYRLGCVAGAKAAWAAPPGPVFVVPPDAPRGEAGACYAMAWNNAGSIVLSIRMEMMNRGNVT